MAATLWLGVVQVQEVHSGSIMQDLWHSLEVVVLQHSNIKTTSPGRTNLHLECFPTYILFLIVPLMYGLPVSMFWKSIIPPGR